MILQTKYFDLGTDTFSFKEPESIRKRLDIKFKNYFTDKPTNTNLKYGDNVFQISLKYEPTKGFFSTPFPIVPEDLIFQDVGCAEGYKIMDDDYTCLGFHYEPNHYYSIDENIIPCRIGFHFCRKLVNCFDYYRPTVHSDMAHNITYDLDVFKFFNVKSNGTTYQLGNKYCTNNITILDECSTEEILKAFKEWITGEWLDLNNFKIKLRGEFYEYHDGIFNKVIPGEKLNNQLTWHIYYEED